MARGMHPSQHCQMRFSVRTVGLVVAGLMIAVLTAVAPVEPAAAARPNPPSNLTVRPDGDSALQLNWRVPSDPDGNPIDRYQVWRSTSDKPATFKWHSAADNPSFRDTGLQSGETYYYYIRAVDSTGAVSWRNGITGATVGGKSDTERPSIPRNLRATGGANNISLSWDAATDNVGVESYRVYRSVENGAFQIVASPTSLSWTDTNVTAGTNYRYYLRAVDAAGNMGWRNGIVRASPTSGQSELLWVVGDMAQCWNDNDERVGSFLEETSGPILALGDVVYPDASKANLERCFEPAFGSVKDRMWAVVGNHEYDANDAADYFSYFGDAAGPAGQGWYEKSVNGWQILVLNSNCWEAGVGCTPGSNQYEWLADRLEARPNACRVVAMHHPRWSSYQNYPDQPFLDPMLNLLHDAGTEIVLAGHAHHYERFMPQTPEGVRTWSTGMRMFIVGTGGVPLRSATGSAANSIVKKDDFYGSLRLELGDDSYSWRFVDVDGVWRDSGRSDCRTN